MQGGGDNDPLLYKALVGTPSNAKFLPHRAYANLIATPAGVLVLEWTQYESHRGVSSLAHTSLPDLALHRQQKHEAMTLT